MLFHCTQPEAERRVLNPEVCDPEMQVLLLLFLGEGQVECDLVRYAEAFNHDVNAPKQLNRFVENIQLLKLLKYNPRLSDNISLFKYDPIHYEYCHDPV